MPDKTITKNTYRKNEKEKTKIKIDKETEQSYTNSMDIREGVNTERLEENKQWDKKLDLMEILKAIKLQQLEKDNK